VMIGVFVGAVSLLGMLFDKIRRHHPPESRLAKAGMFVAEEAAVVVGSALAFKPYGMFMENEADREGAEIAGAQNMAGALTALDKRVAEINRTQQQSWLSRVVKKTATAIFDIHPPMSSRLEHMRRLEEAEQNQPNTQRAI
jgi:Zn-dependent protease with chaperone function